MSLLKTVLIIGVLGYGALLALMYLFQRSLLYFPDTTRYAPATAGLEGMVNPYEPPRSDVEGGLTLDQAVTQAANAQSLAFPSFDSVSARYEKGKLAGLHPTEAFV